MGRESGSSRRRMIVAASSTSLAAVAVAFGLTLATPALSAPPKAPRVASIIDSVPEKEACKGKDLDTKREAKKCIKGLDEPKKWSIETEEDKTYEVMMKSKKGGEKEEPPGKVGCSTALKDQGTPNEVTEETECHQQRLALAAATSSASSAATFNALLFKPLNGNTITNYFPENGQASCSINSDGNLVCVFPSQVSTSGPIDIRLSNPPDTTKPNFQVQRSTDGGATWDPNSWYSTGS